MAASPPHTDGSIVFAKWRQCALACENWIRPHWLYMHRLQSFSLLSRLHFNDFTLLSCLVRVKLMMLTMIKTWTRQTASTSTRWHFAFALCCYSNETRAPIKNPPNSAQRGTPRPFPNFHPASCSSVACDDGQTYTQTNRHKLVGFYGPMPPPVPNAPSSECHKFGIPPSFDRCTPPRRRFNQNIPPSVVLLQQCHCRNHHRGTLQNLSPPSVLFESSRIFFTIPRRHRHKK